jgi:hypothetical protein
VLYQLSYTRKLVDGVTHYVQLTFAESQIIGPGGGVARVDRTPVFYGNNCTGGEVRGRGRRARKEQLVKGGRPRLRSFLLTRVEVWVN